MKTDKTGEARKLFQEHPFVARGIAPWGEQLWPDCELHTLGRDEKLYDEGEQGGNGLWLLLKGQVAIRRKRGMSVDAYETIAEYGEGQILGETSFTDKLPHSTSVYGAHRSGTLVVLIPRDAYDKARQSDPNFAVRFLELVSGNMAFKLRRANLRR